MKEISPSTCLLDLFYWWSLILSIKGCITMSDILFEIVSEDAWFSSFNILGCPRPRIQVKTDKFWSQKCVTIAESHSNSYLDILRWLLDDEMIQVFDLLSCDFTDSPTPKVTKSPQLLVFSTSKWLLEDGPDGESSHVSKRVVLFKLRGKPWLDSPLWKQLFQINSFMMST